MKKCESSKLKSIFSVSLISLLLMAGISLFYSCEQNSVGIFKDNIEYDETSIVSDSIFSILTDYYNSNPDSAIIMADSLEKEFVREGNSSDLLRLYSFLSELYQYRKNDHNTTLEYLIMALDVIADNPDLQFDPTYLYVNIGNIMYQYRLYDDAIYIYRQIPKLTNAEGDPKKMALIYNNIGLSFQKKEMEDSARYYYDKAVPYVYDAKQATAILVLQYNNYVSSLMIQLGDLDSIPYFYNKSMIFFDGMDKVLDDYPSDYASQYKIDIQLEYCKNKVKSLDYMSQYHIDNDNVNEAINLLKEAVGYSKTTNNLLLSADLYLSIADAYVINESFDTAIVYTDSAITIFKDYSIYQNLEMSYRRKADISLLMNNDLEYLSANEIADKYMDTLKTIQTSDDLILMKIELAAKPVQLAMKNIELSRNDKIKTIDNQKFLIGLLIGILIFLVIGFIVYSKLYRNLQNTRVRLAHTTIEKISDKKVSEGNKSHLKDSVEQELLVKFESEIVNKKVYLQSNMSLNLVAEKLETNRSYISKIINSVYKMNYNDYINKLRIDEACNIICNNTNPNFTIDHLYSEVGFGGKTTFYTAFKKYTGVTPAVFFNLNNQAKS